MQALAHVCDEHLFDDFLKVPIADSTGFSLPETLKDSFPGSGGSATKAGAKIQLVWEYKQSLLEHFVLMPWKLPDNKYVDTVVAFARTGGRFLFDLGYFKIKALARIAVAGAYFLTRLNHQANLFIEVKGHLVPFDGVSFLKTSAEHLVEPQISIGTQDLVAARLMASRVPDPVVNERRRAAKKRAKKKGYTPSKAHRELLAWNLFITNVPSTVWTPITVVKAYPMRWQIALIFKSWKSYCHLAASNAKKAETILCYLYGRMRLILINYALYPQVRCAMWVQKRRELSVLRLMRHFQAFADTWLHVIFQGELALRRFLQRACASAERLAAKASRKRRTTAQTLRESLQQQLESVGVVAVVNA